MAYCSINSSELIDLSQDILGQIDEFLGAYKLDMLNDLETQYGYEDTCLILEKVEKDLRAKQDADSVAKANQVKTIRMKLSDVLFKSPEHIIPELNFNPKEANTSLITTTREKTKDGKKIKVEESIISADMSQYLANTLRQQLTRLSIVDLNSDNPRLIRTDFDLTHSIRSWKNSLLKILEDYLKTRGLIPPITSDMTPEQVSNYEKLIMINAWQELQKELAKTSDYKFTAAQDSVGIKTVINPIMALAVLNNFDSVIESLSQDAIVINPKFKHKSQIYSNKYSFSKQSIQNSSFEGDFSDAAYTRILANTLKRIFETIPNGHGGYCTVYDLNAISRHIQTTVGLKEETDLNYDYLFSNTSTPNEKFQALLNILTNSKWDGLHPDLENPSGVRINSCKKEGVSEFHKKYKDSIKLGSIAKHLKLLFDAFNNSTSLENNTVEDEKQLHVQLSIQDQLTSMIKNAQNIAYFRVTENGADINSVSGVRKNKTVSRYKMEDSLQRNIFDKGYLPKIYDARYIIPGSSDTVLTYQNIFSDQYLDHIREITGIDLRTPVLQSFMHEHPVECANIIGRFLDSYKKIVMKHFKGKKFTTIEAFEEERKEMFKDMLERDKIAAQAYVEFTDFVSIENAQDDSILYDQSLHAQPTQGTPTTIGKWVQNQETWKKQRENLEIELGVLEEGNIFMKYPGLRGSAAGKTFNKSLLSDVYVFRQDALVGDDNHRRVIQAYNMKSQESMTQAFNYEFLQPLITDGIMYSQIDCVSDKIRIPLGSLNANAKIPINGKLKMFRDLTEDELMQVYYDQHRCYYKAIEAKLIHDYNILFKELGIISEKFTSLYNCIKQLEQLTEDDLKIAVKRIFAKGGYIELKPQVHFSGKGPDGKLRFNNTLYYHIAGANDPDIFKAIIKSGIQETRKKFIEGKIPFKLKGIEGWQLAKFLGFPSGNGVKGKATEWDKICNDYIKAVIEKKTLHIEDKSGTIPPQYGEIFDKLISKFTIMQNMSAEADLQLSGKMEWIHNGKIRQENVDTINDKLGEIKGVNLNLEEGISRDKANEALAEKLDEVLEPFHTDKSARLVVSKKRYNSLVATFEPVTPGGKFAVAPTQRIAHVEPHTLTLYNYNGDPEHKQATNDGAIFGNGIFDIIESWSYPGKIYSVGSQKIIGIIPGFETITQIKTAKYSINNERIRNGFRSSDLMGDGNRYDFEKAFEKMNRCKLESNWAKKWVKDKRQISKNKIWYSFNGVNAYFNEEELAFIENGDQTVIVPTWTDIDGNKIKIETVAECMGLKLVNGGFVIESVYDLWKLFGAQDSCTRNKITGELIPSESSMEMAALVICEFSPNVKSEMIAKLIDIESAKSGQVNVNGKKDVVENDEDLLYQVVESDRFGIQQDYTHEMIDSDIPLLSQALSGAALNGKNPYVAQIIYDQLSDIVDDSIKSVEGYFGTQEQRIKFKNKLVEELAKSLKKSFASTTADDIVKETLEHIKAWAIAQREGDGSVEYKSLPFSDRNVFSKVTSDMLVALNASGIRQRFEGIAVIQNPSHGVVGVYEDSEGNIYTRQDLLNLANELGYKGNANQKIDQILSDSNLGFGGQSITSISQVTIGDVVLIPDVNNPGYSKRLIIESPLQLWELESILNTGTQKILIDRSTKRDLRTRQISFVDSTTGEVKNLWSLRSTMYRLIVSGEKEKKPTIDRNKVRMYNADAVEEFEKYNIGDTQSLAYMRANYKGLAEKNPYYYPTYEHFITDQKVPVTDVQTRSGEQIIPNVNQERQGIHHSLYKVKSATRTILNKNTGQPEIHHTYFEDVIKNRILKVNKFLLDESGKSVLTKNDFQATLTTNDSEIVVTNHELPYGIEVEAIEQNGEYWLPDEQGNLIFKVKEGKYELQTEDLENGKKLYAIRVIGEGENKLEQEIKKANFLINQVKDVNLYYNDWNFTPVTYKNRLNGISFDPIKQKLIDWNSKSEFDSSKLSELDKYIRSEAEAMYNSFLTTLNTISTRIPSQSWQSFLATTTVAFTENEENDGYMNIWEMWMQGSDFDIDKAYTMMYGLDKSGKIAGNGFIDYSSPESIVESLNTELENPVRGVQFEPQFATTGEANPNITDEDGEVIIWNPDETIIVNGQELTIGEVDTKQYIVVNGQTVISPTSTHRPSIDEYLTAHPEKKIDVYNAILKKISGLNGIIQVNTSAWSKFKDFKSKSADKPIFLSYKWMIDLNRYNRSKIVAYKQNKIMQRMWEVTSGVSNLEAATKPMDSALVNDQMDEINEANGVKKRVYNGYSPVTKFEIQEENSVGKENVGINANGIKALAGLEQYYNIKALNHERVFTPNIDLKFRTSNNKGSRLIGTFKLTKVANTIFGSEDQFIESLYSIYGNDLSGINQNPLIQGIEIVNKFEQSTDLEERKAIVEEHPELFTINKDGQAIPLQQYTRAVEAYKLFAQTKMNINDSGQYQYAKFLYYYSEFEDNAADILSVFISLSTDNAKELRLAMMNATPELMSIPIALVTYGMDLRSVLDMCMNTLGPIVKAMSANRFAQNNPKKLKVEDAIEVCRKNKTLDGETCDSLLKVIALTSELRYLTSMYKINQGASTDLIELQRWIGNLKNVKSDKEKSRVKLESGITIGQLVAEAQQLILTRKRGPHYDELVKRCALTSEVTPEAEQRLQNALSVAFDSVGNSLPIDFGLLFRANDSRAESYRQAMIDYFNIISIGHNVIDVILNSASFKSQLRATMRQLDVFNSMICTSAISQTLINRDIQKQTDQFKSLTSKESDNRTKMLFGHLSVGEFVKRLKGFTFVKGDIDSAFTTLVNIQGDPESSFDLSTNIGIKNFMRVVHDQVVPYLKQTYGDNNFFVRSLVDKLNRSTEMIYTTLPFNSFAGQDQQIERSNIAEAKIAFAKIMKQSSGLKNKDGKDLSIGEVFYVYNMIATAGSMNSMKTCVEQIGTYSELPSQYEDVVREFDAITESVNGDLDKLPEDAIINPRIIDKLVAINQALNGNYSYTSDNGTQVLSLKKEWIYTLVDPTQNVELKTIESKLKEQFPSIHKIEFLAPTSINNNQLATPYTVTFKYTVGVPGSNNTWDIEDSINGIIYSEGGYINQSELETIRYAIQSKIKYAEDFIDENFFGELIETVDFKKEVRDQLKIDSSSRLVDTIINSLPDNVKVKIVRGKMSTEEDIIPHILQMNGEICLILPYTDEPNYNSPEFINCLLTIKSGSTSQVQNLIELMKISLDPKKYPNIRKDNYKTYLRKIVDDGDSLKMYELIQPYVNWVIGEATNPSFKQQAKLQLDLFEQVFNKNTRDFYFEKLVDNPENLTPEQIKEINESNATPLQVGDIFDVEGEKYLYTCRSNSGVYILSPLTNPDADIIPLLVNPSSIYVKQYAKKRSPNVVLGKVNKIQFKYAPIPDKEIKIFEELGIGDLLTFDGQEYIVSDITINRNEEEEIIIQSTKDDELFVQLEKDDYEMVESVYTASVNIISGETDVNEFDSEFEIPIEILNTLSVNDLISTLTIQEATFQKLVSIVTANGATKYIILASKDGKTIQIDPEDITSITSHRKIIDPTFDAQSKPLTIYVNKEGIEDSLYKSKYKGISWTEAGDASELKDISTGYVKSGYRKLIGCDGGGVPIYTLTGYHVVQGVAPSVGDIIEINDNGTIRLMKVKDIKGSKIFGLVQTPNVSSQVYKTIESGQVVKVYQPIPTSGKLTDRYSIPENVDAKLSNYHKGKRVMQVLSERYKMDVTLENIDSSDPNGRHFAFVKDGKIVINTAKFAEYNAKLRAQGEDELNDISEYIMIKGIHEFTHLVIAGIQARDGNNYYQLMNYIKQIITNRPKGNKAWNKDVWEEVLAGGDVYGPTNGEISDAQAQEYLVIMIENAFRTNAKSFLDNSITDNGVIEGIKSIMNAGFKSFTGGALQALSGSSNTQLKNIFLDFQRDVFGYATEDMSLEFIKRNYLESQYVDKIKCF